MKKFIYIFVLLLATVKVIAQGSQAIYIGETMPDYSFPRMLHYPSATLDMRDLRGKLVILDFWDSTCSSCIDFMPHLQELQDQFKQDIQIILVNGYMRDDASKVNKIISNIKKYRGCTISLPVALCDSALLQYFPHRGRPYEVLVDRSGKVVATTSAEDITATNIQAVLNGQQVSFSVRNDFWDVNLPSLFRIDKRRLEDIIFDSSITKALQIPPTGLRFDKQKRIIGTSMVYTLIQAYRTAFRRELFYDSPIIAYNTRDSAFLNFPGTNEPIAYVYDISCPAGMFSENFFDTCLKQDLERAFNFSLQRVFRDTSCLVIRTNKRLKTIYTSKAIEDGNIDHLVSASKNGLAVYADSITVPGLIGWLNLVFSKGPAGTGPTAKIVNEATDAHSIDIKFPAGFNLGNFEKVRSYLSARGIDLTVEKRRQPVVVISDKKPGAPTISPNS